MRFLKVIYNDETSFILKVIEELELKHVEFYNIDDYRQKKKAIPIMTRNGTKLVPLIVFENENIEECDCIWSEQKPDWKLEIIKKLQE